MLFHSDVQYSAQSTMKLRDKFKSKIEPKFPKGIQINKSISLKNCGSFHGELLIFR